VFGTPSATYWVTTGQKENRMIFYIIGVVVVIALLLAWLT
jgi:hypothetical protein